MARYAHLGFTVAQDTLNLMKKMVASGEVDALVAERVWQEMQKALGEKTPTAFITTLQDCGALKIILPELDCLWGVPQPALHHPEIDTGIHTLLVLEQACQLSKNPQVRFASLLHDLGKGTTPKTEWPRHIAHEARGADIVKKVCLRLRAPKEYRDLAIITARLHLNYHRALELKPRTVIKLLEQLDAFRRPERFEHFLLACEADARGRIGFENKVYQQGDYLRQAFTYAKNINIGELRQQGFEGRDLADEIKKTRTKNIAELKKEFI
jgi:tRNA nucleotidyltransferase (CCA-adding enzyme)